MYIVLDMFYHVSMCFLYEPNCKCWNIIIFRAHIWHYIQWTWKLYVKFYSYKRSLPLAPSTSLMSAFFPVYSKNARHHNRVYFVQCVPKKCSHYEGLHAPGAWESPCTGCMTGLTHRVHGAFHDGNTFVGTRCIIP